MRRTLNLILAAFALPAVCVLGQVNGDRLLADVQFLASDSLRGRGAGTEGNSVARAHILKAFQDAGLSDVSEVPFTYRDDRPGVNVIGFAPGRSAERGYIVLTAHFDHLGVRGEDIYNGADDNASGTAAIMELARYIAKRPLRHTVVFAALDAEEQGLQGARALVADFPVPLDSVDLNVNLDMVSRSEKGELYAAGTHHYPQLRELVEPLVADLPVKLLFGHDLPGTGSDDWTNASDHAPFHAAAIPFLYFGVEDHPGYHNPSDDFEDITPEFYVNAVRSIYRIVETLDQQFDRQ